MMIKSRLNVLMGEKKIRSIRQLSEQTGISRLSLTNLYDDDGKGIDYKTLDKLCRYFQCQPGDILVWEEGE
jgi:putative transcriptional regulator